MNLTARREPTFHDGAHSGAQRESYSAGAAAPAAGSRASGLTRLVATVQIAGSLLAVPLGLASGYSIYRANFSVETTCQTLRSNIIGMLDKSVDAATRRMLVRRDIEAFEQTCGSVDPDAHAAFKMLLAGGTRAAAASAAPKAHVAAPPVAVARKADAKPVIKQEPKQESKQEPKLEAKPDAIAAKLEAEPDSKPEAGLELKPALVAGPEAAPRDASLSDTRWLAAVRQALVTHDPEPAAAPLELSKSPRIVLQPAWNAAAAPPASPRASSTDQMPANPTPAKLMNADHPVPPASIPTAAPVGEATPVSMEERGGSRIGGWIAQIPFVGRVIEPRGN